MKSHSKLSNWGENQPQPRDPQGAVIPQSQAAIATEPSPKPTSSFLKKCLKPTHWQFWVLATLIPGTIGILGLAMLLRLPTLPNCPSIFWPTASASLRMYCGELAASKQTVKDLLYAIELVNALPQDHPLRPRVNQYIETWAEEILNLGAKVFNEGKLDEAIAIAEKVPPGTSARELVSDRIKVWREIWADAETIYERVKELIQKEEWNAGFRIATQLLFVQNNYWQTTKYQEVTGIIETARKDGEQLSKARRLARNGTVEDILEAIKIAEAITEKSYIYKRSREQITEFGKQLLKIASSEADQGNLSEALMIANQIPESAKLNDDVQDFLLLTTARQEASQDTVSGFENAVLRAQRITANRPLYNQAQELIARWQREMVDVAHLEKARNLARAGTVQDLSAAIAEVSLIPVNNPRYSEAQEVSSSWRSEIERIQDGPYLNRADTLAMAGNMPALKAAIAEAQLIAPGRALYAEAQRKIQQWSTRVESTEDQPYLDSADQWAMRGDLASLQNAIAEASRISEGRALYREAQSRIDQWRGQIEQTQDRPLLQQAQDAAMRGNLAEAIQLAQRINPNRALYEEAAREIRRWRSQLSAQSNLSEARRIAQAGTPEALAAAIQTADQIDRSSVERVEADTAIGQWSQQIFSQAQDRASYDVAGAIAIAERIPPSSNLYGTVRSQIATWQRQLTRPPQLPQLP